MNRRSHYSLFVKPVLAALAIAVGAMLTPYVGAEARGSASYSLPALLSSGNDPLGLISATEQFQREVGDARLKRVYETNDVRDVDVSGCGGSPRIIYRALDILPPLEMNGAWILEAQANHQVTIPSRHQVASTFQVGRGLVSVDEKNTEFCRQWANATEHAIIVDPSELCPDGECTICPALVTHHVALGEDGEDRVEGMASEPCYTLGNSNSPGGGITPY